MSTIQDMLNLTNPQELADLLRALKVGDLVRSMKTYLYAKAPAASSYQLATLQAFVLPDGAKAATILRAYARAGSGTLGELAIQAYGATPTAGQIAVAPSGDIVVLAADAWTSVDIVYEPAKFDVFQATLPVTSDAIDLAALLPAQAAQGVLSLLEAEVMTGTSVGKKIVVKEGAAPGTAQQFNLNLAKNKIQSHAGDGATSVRFKLALAPATDVDAKLQSSATY